MALLGSLTCRETKVQGPGRTPKAAQPSTGNSYLSTWVPLPPVQHRAVSQFCNLFAPSFPSSHGPPPWEGLQELGKVREISCLI